VTVAETRLPSAFAELEPFAEKWCLATEAERWDMRMATPMPVMREFYDAFAPRLEEAIDYCDKFPLDDIGDDALNLLHLIYSMVMVSMAIEVFGQQKPTDSADAVIDRVGEPLP
jgi:hypothetical protein